MSRKKARDAAVKLIYSAEMNDDFSKEYLDFMLASFECFDIELGQVPLDPESMRFAKDVCYGFAENREMIDQKIGEHSSKWDFQRLGKVDLAILRVAAYEILFRSDIPTSVVVNEAIENAKKYCETDSYRFINGVLGSIAKDGEKVE